MSGAETVVRPGGSRALTERLASLPVTLAPARSLLRYYAISCIPTGPAYPFVLAFLYFRWRTLRYELDDEGITMRWGILFRREISLSYARIQDIHLSSNVIERWLGLGRIQVQTASGSAGAEMKIEGIEEVDTLRDFLYSRMRGVDVTVGAPSPDAAADRERPPALVDAAATAGPAIRPAPDAHPAAAADIPALTEMLREVAREMRALREALANPDRAGGGPAGPGGARP